MQGPLPRIERALDPVAGTEPIACPSDVSPPGPLHRQRCARPDQDPDRDPRRHLRQQPVQRHRPLAAGELELGGDVPAREVYVRLGGGDGFRHRRQRCRAIDQHLERVSGPRPWIALGPASRRRIDRRPPADAAESSPVMRTGEPLDQLTERAIRNIQWISPRHVCFTLAGTISGLNC